VKLAQENTEVHWKYIVFIRSVFLVVGGYICGKCCSVDFGYTALAGLPKRMKISLLKRGIYGYGAAVSTVISIELMPVSISISIMMSTVFLTPIVAFFIRNEKLSCLEMSVITGGVMGMIILTNPSWFTRDTEYLQQRL